MKFTYGKKGEAKWSDAEVDLLINQHEKHLVANEVGPMKDEIKALKANHKSEMTALQTTADEATAEVKTLKSDNEKLTNEVEPVRKAALLDKRKELAKGIVADGKLADAIQLAGVTEDDTDEQVIAKLTKTVETRDFLKAAPEKTPEQLAAEKAEAEKLAAQQKSALTPAQLAAISTTQKPGAPKVKTLEELAKEDVVSSDDDSVGSWLNK